ncbi:hypothetical protein [Brevundimonas sp. GCM10030266]
MKTSTQDRLLTIVLMIGAAAGAISAISILIGFAIALAGVFVG